MTSSDKDQHDDEIEALIDTQSLNAEAPAVSFNHETDEGVQQESLSGDQDSELKTLLQRDAEKSKYGNAIEKQKSRAKSRNPGMSSSSTASVEYQYHTDRILLVVVIGLLVATFLGWGLYLLLSKSSSEAPAAFEVISDGSVQANEVTEQIELREQSLADRLDALESVAPASQVQETVEQTSAQPIETEVPQALTQARAPQAQAAVAKPDFQLSGNQTQQDATAQSGSTQEGILQPNLVSRAHLARGVRQFEPVGLYEDGVVSLEGRNSFRLFWFTHLTNLDGQQVSHVWFYEGAQVAQVNMNIGSMSWRASSNKRIAADTLGQWKVQAVNGEGKVLASQSFQVVQ